MSRFLSLTCVLVLAALAVAAAQDSFRTRGQES